MNEMKNQESKPFFSHLFSKVSYLSIVFITIGYIFLAWEVSLDFLLNLAPVVLYGFFFILVIKFRKLEGHRFSRLKHEITFFAGFLSIGLALYLLRLLLERPSGLRLDPLYNAIYYAPLNEELLRIFYILLIYLFLISFRSEKNRTKYDWKFGFSIFAGFSLSSVIWVLSHTQYDCDIKLRLGLVSFAYLGLFLIVQNIIVCIFLHTFSNSLVSFMFDGRLPPAQGLGSFFTTFWFVSLLIILLISLTLSLLWYIKNYQFKFGRMNFKYKHSLKLLGLGILCVSCPFAMHAQFLFIGYPHSITLYENSNPRDESFQIFRIQYDHDKLYFDYDSNLSQFQLQVSFSNSLIGYSYLKFVCLFQSYGYLSGYNFTITFGNESEPLAQGILNGTNSFLSLLVPLPYTPKTTSLILTIVNITPYPSRFLLDQFILLV